MQQRSVDTHLALPPVRSDVAAATRDLGQFGFTRLGGLLTAREIADARERLMEQAAGEDAAGVSYHYGAQAWQSTKAGTAGPNQRVLNLLNKGKVFRRIAMNHGVHELIRHMLGEDFLLSSFAANIVSGGGVPGPMHSDQHYVPASTPYAMVSNALWMLDDFTEQNGATNIVPASHRRMRTPAADEGRDECVQATGPAGVAFVFDGRLWHSIAANGTTAPRCGLLAYYARPFVRQQENYALTLAPEVLADMDGAELELVGFRPWNTLGRTFGQTHGHITRPTNWVRELRP
jgi:Phytanoyl-CoA dioxygenase (PhyH)